MVCPLRAIGSLSLGGQASVPFGLGLMSVSRSALATLICLSDLLTKPGVRWVASFPSRLFLGKRFVLPRIGVTHRLIGTAEPVPTFSGVPAPAWRFLQDRHD
jgi:hypothetical protein